MIPHFTPAEEAALRADTIAQLAARTGLSTSTISTARRGSSLSRATFEKLRASLATLELPSFDEVSNGDSAPVVQRRVSKNGSLPLPTKDQKALKQLIAKEGQGNLCQRTGISEAAYRAAKFGKPIRPDTIARIQAVLGGTSDAAPIPLVPAKVHKVQVEQALKAVSDEHGPNLEKLAGFIEGQVLMAEFISMSVLKFLGGDKE